MKKTRRHYDREFKISAVAELESGKPLAQIACEYWIHPGLPPAGEMSWLKNPETAFSGNRNRHKDNSNGRFAFRQFQKLLYCGPVTFVVSYALGSPQEL